MLRSRVASYDEEHLKNLSDQIDSIPAERLNIKKAPRKKNAAIKQRR